MSHSAVERGWLLSVQPLDVHLHLTLSNHLRFCLHKLLLITVATVVFSSFQEWCWLLLCGANNKETTIVSLSDVGPEGASGHSPLGLNQIVEVPKVQHWWLFLIISTFSLLRFGICIFITSFLIQLLLTYIRDDFYSIMDLPLVEKEFISIRLTFTVIRQSSIMLTGSHSQFHLLLFLRWVIFKFRSWCCERCLL